MKLIPLSKIILCGLLFSFGISTPLIFADEETEQTETKIDYSLPTDPIIEIPENDNTNALN